ncbi:MAG TPA: family 10 glycosylhydrolase [Gemmatimonadaceae bacterium]|nr:family 10 glycosylhydrolase [Gemmatimonadaceae bacterium]
MRVSRFTISLGVAALPLVALVPRPAVAQATAVPAASAAPADAPPPIRREFRGVWVATVGNIDWPSKRGLSTAQQQAELVTLLDSAVALHLNAIVLQVRPAADALYASRIEPWSEFLTGREGQAPSPWYDPLAFAVKEAHARGLELHAWFNPYRAGTPGQGRHAATHVSRTIPAVVKKYGPYLWMDPGEPSVRKRTVRVILDVVRRYDIDGVHLDDYFYPYEEWDSRSRVIDFPDTRSWKKYRRSGGRLSRADWRRRNVDLLVQELYTGIHRVKPWVKFGVSPFGIWRPGNPASITGFDAYTRLYADSRKWLRNGWVDYYTPQLYWPIADTPHSYSTLLDWWVGQNVKKRNIWPGQYTNKAGANGESGWRAQEILDQIDATRIEDGATGNVHFSGRAFLENPDSLHEKLRAGPYADLALVPASRWLDSIPPAAPKLTLHGAGVQLPTGGPDTLHTPMHVTVASGQKAKPALWTLRTRADSTAAWTTAILPASEDRLPIPSGATEIVVTAIDRAGNQSAPTRLTLPAPAP